MILNRSLNQCHMTAGIAVHYDIIQCIKSTLRLILVPAVDMGAMRSISRAFCVELAYSILTYSYNAKTAEAVVGFMTVALLQESHTAACNAQSSLKRSCAWHMLYGIWCDKHMSSCVQNVAACV